MHTLSDKIVVATFCALMITIAVLMQDVQVINVVTDSVTTFDTQLAFDKAGDYRDHIMGDL